MHSTLDERVDFCDGMWYELFHNGLVGVEQGCLSEGKRVLQ